MGIGCACSPDQKYTCYFAVAKEVKNRDIVERIPDFQDFLKYTDLSDRCQDQCSYRSSLHAIDGQVKHGMYFLYEDSCPEYTHDFTSSGNKLCSYCTELYDGADYETCSDTSPYLPDTCLGTWGKYYGDTWDTTMLGVRRNLNEAQDRL